MSQLNLKKNEKKVFCEKIRWNSGVLRVVRGGCRAYSACRTPSPLE